MNTTPVCVVFSEDPDLVRQVRVVVEGRADARFARDRAELCTLADRWDPTVVLLDIRGATAHDLAGELAAAHPGCVLVALGDPRSAPGREAARHGAFAVLPVPPEIEPFRRTVTHALSVVRLMQENRWLRDDAARRRDPAPAPPAPPAPDPQRPLWHFYRALRHLDRPPACLADVIEGVCSSVAVSRAGVFALQEGAYRLRAGLRCLADTAEARYTREDPFVRWMERQAHLVSRGTLERIAEPAVRFLLLKALDVMGAEIIAPLFAHGCLLGWFFLGHRVTGAPFEYGDLEELSGLAEHVATALENTLLYEELGAQKTMAETLLHAIPTAIVTVDVEGRLRWFNQAASALFGPELAAAMGRPVETWHGRLADLLRRAAAGEEQRGGRAWRDPLTGRFLSIETRRLEAREEFLGTAALLEDRTAARELATREGELERAAFWQELASGMSHEIRNPLVAIKTFAQLLPERYADADFRDEFHRLVSEEVDRLTVMVDRIANFANPPPLNRRPLGAARLLERAAEPWKKKLPSNVRLIVAPEADTPGIAVDGPAVSAALDHLLANAAEALGDRAGAEIRLESRTVREPSGRCEVTLIVRDNGPGIDPAVRPRVFSPFCTTKAQGMGLGLPIARRTVHDHGGEIEVEGGDVGTAVLLRFAAHVEEEDA